MLNSRRVSTSCCKNVNQGGGKKESCQKKRKDTDQTESQHECIIYVGKCKKNGIIISK